MGRHQQRTVSLWESPRIRPRKRSTTKFENVCPHSSRVNLGSRRVRASCGFAGRNFSVITNETRLHNNDATMRDATYA